MSLTEKSREVSALNRADTGGSHHTVTNESSARLKALETELEKCKAEVERTQQARDEASYAFMVQMDKLFYQRAQLANLDEAKEEADQANKLVNATHQAHLRAVKNSQRIAAEIEQLRSES